MIFAVEFIDEKIVPLLSLSYINDLPVFLSEDFLSVADTDQMISAG